MEVYDLQEIELIFDPLYKSIGITQIEKKIIQSDEFNRLRFINQLGFVNLIYPGANHTRFEHSLGVLKLASRIPEDVISDDDKKQILRLAALLHDIGHGPLSHVSESICEYNNCKIKHEEITKQKIECLFPSYSSSYDGKEIAKIAIGKSKKQVLISELISSDLDLDRMDYLIRDSYYCGLFYGNVDVDRLIDSSIKEKSGHFVIDKKKGLISAESFLFARKLMYNAVYYHHTNRTAQLMLIKAFTEFIKEGNPINNRLFLSKFDSSNKKEWPNLFSNMTDFQFFNEMLQIGGFQKDIIKRLYFRELYKPVWVNWQNLHPFLKDKIENESKKNSGKVIIKYMEELERRLLDFRDVNPKVILL